MKMLKWIVSLLVMLCLCATACAEMHLGQHSPEEWADRADILRITHVDTNRSDCLLIEAYGKIMLVDGGYSGYNAHVRDVLDEKGVKNLDWILNTHPHDDHIDGANVLMRNGYTADVFLSVFPKNTDDTHQRGCVQILDKLGIPYVQMEDGYTITVEGEGLPLNMIVRTTGSRDFNDGSALLLIRFGESKAMLMADLTRGAQRKLMEMMPLEELQAEVIKAPHHGITYFDNDFLANAAPELVTIPNKYDYNLQIAQQCHARKIPYLFAGSGDIIMETDGVDWYQWQLPQAK